MGTWAEFIINTITRPQREDMCLLTMAAAQVGGPAQKEMWLNEVPRGVTYSEKNASSNMFSTISQAGLLTETRHSTWKRAANDGTWG